MKKPHWTTNVWSQSLSQIKWIHTVSDVANDWIHELISLNDENSGLIYSPLHLISIWNKPRRISGCCSVGIFLPSALWVPWLHYECEVGSSRHGAFNYERASAGRYGTRGLASTGEGHFEMLSSSTGWVGKSVETVMNERIWQCKVIFLICLPFPFKHLVLRRAHSGWKENCAEIF